MLAGTVEKIDLLNVNLVGNLFLSQVYYRSEKYFETALARTGFQFKQLQ
jgi:hypothetical protein